VRGWTDHWLAQQGQQRVRNQATSRTLLEGATAQGESPVGESDLARRGIREYGGTREIPLEAGGTTLQG
jgi:hypothetical protein